jgi:hypothetical protein
MGVGADLDIRPLAGRTQERRRGGDAAAVLDGALDVGHALLDGAVIIGVAGDAERHSAIHEGLAQRVLPLHRGHVQAAVAAAILLVAGADAFLHPLEVRQHVGIAPAAIAHLRPGVEILTLAAVVDMAVDRGRAAERLAARRIDAAAIGVGPRLLLVAPIDALHVEGLDEAGRQMDVGVPVARPRLQHAYRDRRVLAEAAGQHAAGRAGAHDHIVERIHLVCRPAQRGKRP